MIKSKTENGLQSAKGVGLIILMLIVDSTFFIFARLLQPYMPAQQSTFYMMGTGTLIIVIYAAFKKKLRFRILRENLGFFVLIGFLVAVSTNLNYIAMSFIDPGTASILCQATIVFGLFWGLVWLKEKLDRRQAIGALIAISGVIVITFQKGDYLRLGSLLVLISSLCYSFHSAVVKKYGDKFDFIEFFAFRLICNVFFLFLMVVFTTGFDAPPAPAIPLLLIAAVVEVCLSRSLYYMLLRKYPFSILSIILTLSPILTVVWSLILFGTIPTWLQIAGGACVIAGVLVMAGFPGRLQKPVQEKEVLPEQIIGE